MIIDLVEKSKSKYIFTKEYTIEIALPAPLIKDIIHNYMLVLSKLCFFFNSFKIFIKTDTHTHKQAERERERERE